MTWQRLLRRLGGAASTRQLSAAGASPHALTRAVVQGELVRPRHGIYALPDLPAGMMTALQAGGRLSCLSAARTYGLWGGTDRRVHLQLPPHAGRGGQAEVRHWRRCEPHPEIWRLSLHDCLRSVVRCADQQTAIAVLDTAVSSRRIRLAGLQRIFADEPRASRVIAARARPGSDSGVESIFRQLLQSRGRIVEQQVAVPGVGNVDARVDGTLYVEIDGYEYHSNPVEFARDRERDTEMVLLGLRRLRFSAGQVLDHPDHVVETVEDALEMEERVGGAPEAGEPGRRFSRG